jgi:hypothetical protein
MGLTSIWSAVSRRRNYRWLPAYRNRRRNRFAVATARGQGRSRGEHHGFVHARVTDVMGTLTRAPTVVIRTPKYRVAFFILRVLAWSRGGLRALHARPWWTACTARTIRPRCHAADGMDVSKRVISCRSFHAGSRDGLARQPKDEEITAKARQDELRDLCGVKTSSSSRVMCRPSQRR